MNLKHTDVDFCPIYFSQLGMSFVNLEIYCNVKWITVHLNINACLLQYIYLLFFYCFKYVININYLWFCVYVFLPFSEGKKYLVYNWVICWTKFLPFATIFFPGQDDLKQQLFVRSIPLQLLWLKKEVQLRFHLKMKTYLTKKMLQILMRTLYEVS